MSQLSYPTSRSGRSARALAETQDKSALEASKQHYAGWTIFALFFMSVVMLQVLQKARGGSELSGDGDIFRQLGYMLVFAMAIFGLRVGRDLGQLLVIPTSFVLLFAWCWLSLLWAIEPAIAFRRLVLTTIIVLTAMLAVNNAGTDRSIGMLRWLLVGTLLLNYVMVAVSPTGVHQFTEVGNTALIGNWRGAMMQKNFAGAICAITIIFFAFGNSGVKSWMRWSVIAASGIFLWNTQSKTSLYLLLPALMVGWAYMRLNKRQIRFILPALLVLGLMVGILAEGLIEQTSELFGRPDAFTGRGQIWPILIEYAATQPLLGSGFGSFWNVGPSSPVFQMAYSWVAELGNGHNGYLDVLVQLGYPGLILAVIAVILRPAWNLLTKPTIAPQTGALLLALLVFCTGNNFTESTLLDRDMMVWVFMVFIVAMEQKADSEGKKRLVQESYVNVRPDRARRRR